MHLSSPTKTQFDPITGKYRNKQAHKSNHIQATDPGADQMISVIKQREKKKEKKRDRSVKEGKEAGRKLPPGQEQQTLH